MRQTEREVHALTLPVRGHTNREIATALSITLFESARPAAGSICSSRCRIGSTPSTCSGRQAGRAKG
ncbi:hypothetical protein ACFYUD_15495 [Nocardia tengchongensis]|uniref:hypothetical protein n=1 Tax=Nocardia tengchongensis TaxID=2055889 RepID=UPI0036C52BEB